MSVIVRDALGMAQAQLERFGKPNAKVDAELIFRHLFGLDKMGLYKMWGTVLADELFDRYLDLVAIRSGGTPLQHITGEQDFMGRTFAVNKLALIPRQDTEVLAEEALDLLENAPQKSLSVLDLCCGSGVLGITVALSSSKAKVTASDVSHAALALARQNAARLSAEKKVNFAEGDLFAPFKKMFGRTSKFDMILTNPPYIPSDEIETLEVEVRDHEPRLALDGGPDGLDFYRRILAEAPAYLSPDGLLLLEIGHDQAAPLKELASTGPYKDFRVKRDLAGKDRVCILKIE